MIRFVIRVVFVALLFTPLAAVADDARVEEKLDANWMTEAVTDKGYHGNDAMITLAEMNLRSYVAEPDRGRRDWKDVPDEVRDSVYANRRRIKGERGKRLMRKRGELIERSFAHGYETGAMRRTHVRGHANILKRLLVHAGAFNLALLMRTLIGVGTPRGLQGRLVAVLTLVVGVWTRVVDFWCPVEAPSSITRPHFTPHHRFELLPIGASEWAV